MRPSNCRPGLNLKQAMAIGTAGLTAMLSLLPSRTTDVRVKPTGGSAELIVVTGAAGGVGSIAVALLAVHGYKVAASTGRTRDPRLPARARRHHDRRPWGSCEEDRAAGLGAMGGRDRHGRWTDAGVGHRVDRGVWRRRCLRSRRGRRIVDDGVSVHPAERRVAGDQLGRSAKTSARPCMGAARAWRVRREARHDRQLSSRCRTSRTCPNRSSMAGFAGVW